MFLSLITDKINLFLVFVYIVGIWLHFLPDWLATIVYRLLDQNATQSAGTRPQNVNK